MKRNPIVPYILIMAFGIGLIFFMSLYGVGERENATTENGETTGETTTGGTTDSGFDGAAVAQQSCISCHGNNLEGGAVGPALVGTTLSKEEIVEILKNGEGMMPAFKDIDQEAMADYILSLQ